MLFRKISVLSYFARKSHGDLTSYCLAMSLKQKSNKETRNVAGLHAVMLKARAVNILLMKKLYKRQVE